MKGQQERVVFSLPLSGPSGGRKKLGREQRNMILCTLQSLDKTHDQGNN